MRTGKQRIWDRLVVGAALYAVLAVVAGAQSNYRVVVTTNTSYTPGATIPMALMATGTCDNTTYVRGDGVCSAPSGNGDVVGPASSTDTAIARFNSTTGKLLLNSGILIDASNNLSGVANFLFGGTFANTADISPSQLTADQNDWSPTGLSTASIIRIDTDNYRALTGLAGGADGREIVLMVLETAQGPLVLMGQSASSTAANRFILPARRMFMWPGEIATLIYDNTSSRWRLKASPYQSGSVIGEDATQAAEEFMSGVNGTGTVTEAGESIGALDWRSTVNGTAASTSPASIAAHPGIIQLVTGAVSGNDTRLHLANAATDDIWRFQDVQYASFLVRTTDTTTNRIKVGLCQDCGDGTVAAWGTEGVFVEFDTATSTFWRTHTRNASTSTTNTTSVTVTNNEWDLIEMIRLASGNWAFIINETIVFTHSANLPTSVFANIAVFVETQTAAARNVQVDRIEIRTLRYGQRWTT